MSRRWVIAAAGLLLLLVSAAVALAVGPANLTPGDILGSLWHHLTGTPTPLTPIQEAILWQGRAPRVLTALAVGAGLGIAGTTMQAILHNPLADPYLLGLSSGASLGAVTVLLLGASALVPIAASLLLPAAAFVGALLALALTLVLAGATTGGRLAPGRTVLAGVAVAQGCGALTSLVIFTLTQGDDYREVLGWLMGTLGAATWTSAAIAGAAFGVVGLFLLTQGRTLDAFAFGDVTAVSLGVDTARTRWILLGATALLTGALVSVSGAIGFVGLVVPHAARALVGVRNTRVLPLAALLGAGVLLWADTAARVIIAPRELPVGILTAAIGAPVFAVLLARSGRREAA